VSTEIDIYVAGFEESGSGYVTKYWKNDLRMNAGNIQHKKVCST
jgi:hypothetical protein